MVTCFILLEGNIVFHERKASLENLKVQLYRKSHDEFLSVCNISVSFTAPGFFSQHIPAQSHQNMD